MLDESLPNLVELNPEIRHGDRLLSLSSTNPKGYSDDDKKLIRIPAGSDEDGEESEDTG